MRYSFSVHHHFIGLTWPTVDVQALDEETRGILSGKLIGVTRVEDTVLFDFNAPLTDVESQALTGVVEAHTGLPAELDNTVTVGNYHPSGRIEKKIVYQDTTETGKVEEVDYFYQGNMLTKTITTFYNLDGVTVERYQTSHFYTRPGAGGRTEQVEKRGKKGGPP